ncbi:hypothetical protein [Amycolatopsis orientalis]|uniref:hypothetical protein n=1 Tax=Amycolatopsis orientalis TaxID=31958 RepID=UPI00055FAFE3|nr:hypothetical protein [Amycolatopsis orientalis]
MYLGDTGLLPGERVIWEGAPKRLPAFEKSDLAIVPVLLFMGAWYYFYTRDGEEFPVVWYGVPVFVVLSWIWQAIQRYLKLKSTSYAVTDQRVVAWVKGNVSTSAYLEALGPPQMVERGDGTGTVTFSTRTVDSRKGTGFLAGLLRTDDDALPELSGIEDPRRVRDLIATAQRRPKR